MLINGLQVNKNGIMIGASHTSCHLCAMKYKAEHSDVSLSECYDAVRGQQLNKRVKILSTLKDPNGEKVFICEDCAKNLLDELQKA